MKERFKFVWLSAADACELYNLEKLCFNQHWNLEQWKSSFNNRQFQAWGLRDESGIAGYLSAMIVADEMEVINFAVHPQYRSLGLGKKLFNEVLQAAAKMGIHKTALETRESNDRAIAIYENAGFIQCGLRKDYYADTGENGLLYIKKM